METLNSALPYLKEYSYLGVFVLIFVSIFIPPSSKTLVLVAAGVLASQGIGVLTIYLLVGAFALLLVDCVYFFLGYFNSRRFLHWLLRAGADRQQKLRRAEDMLHEKDWLAVFIARFLPFIRGFIYFVAGLNQMNPLRFVMVDLLSIACFVPMPVLLGYYVGENSSTLIEYASHGELLLALLAILLVLGVVIRFLVTRKK